MSTKNLKVVEIEHPETNDMAEAFKRGFEKIPEAKAVVVLLVMKDGSYKYEKSQIWTSDLALLTFMLHHMTQERFYEDSK